LPRKRRLTHGTRSPRFRGPKKRSEAQHGKTDVNREKRKGLEDEEQLSGYLYGDLWLKGLNGKLKTQSTIQKQRTMKTNHSSGSKGKTGIKGTGSPVYYNNVVRISADLRNLKVNFPDQEPRTVGRTRKGKENWKAKAPHHRGKQHPRIWGGNRERKKGGSTIHVNAWRHPPGEEGTTTCEKRNAAGRNEGLSKRGQQQVWGREKTYFTRFGKECK